MSDAAILQRVYKETIGRRSRISRESKVEIVNSVRYLRLFEGKSPKEIGEMYDIHPKSVDRIASGEYYRDVPLDERMREAVAAREAGQ